MAGGQDLCGRLACPWSSCHWPWYIEFLEILHLAKGYSYFRKGQVIKLQSQGLPFFVGCSTFASLFFLEKPPVSINGSTKMSLPSPLWLYPLSEILGTDYFLRWVEWAFLPSNFQSLRLVLWVFRWVLGTTDQWPKKPPLLTPQVEEHPTHVTIASSPLRRWLWGIIPHEKVKK